MFARFRKPPASRPAAHFWDAALTIIM